VVGRKVQLAPFVISCSETLSRIVAEFCQLFSINSELICFSLKVDMFYYVYLDYQITREGHIAYFTDTVL